LQIAAARREISENVTPRVGNAPSSAILTLFSLASPKEQAQDCPAESRVGTEKGPRFRCSTRLLHDYRSASSVALRERKAEKEREGEREG